MRRPVSVVCLLLAWLCATGGLLDVAQVVAWTRMFATYVRTMPVGEAVSRTFDPEEPCALCLAVQKARDASRKQTPAPPLSVAKQLVLICHEADVVMPPSMSAASLDPGLASGSSWCPPVAVPPPRSGRAVHWS